MTHHHRLTNSVTYQSHFSLLPNINPKLTPLCSCPYHPSPSQSYSSISSSNLNNFPLFFTKPKPLQFNHQTGSSAYPSPITHPEPEHCLPHPNAQKEDLLLKSQQQVSQFSNRFVYGLGIGITIGGVVLAGGWVFMVAFAAVVFACAREYFELVRSRGIIEGMAPPPRYV